MQIDLLSLALGGLVGAVISAPIGFWYALFAVRPRLKIVGGGTGGVVEGWSIQCISIGNPPGVFGFDLGETVIFGKVVFDRLRKGLIVERQIARNCMATLQDEEGTIFPLIWKKRGEANFSHSINLSCGEEASLYLMARERDKNECFVFVDPRQLTEGTPRYKGRAKFVLVVKCNDVPVIEETAQVSRDHAGRLTFLAAGMGGGL